MIDSVVVSMEHISKHYLLYNRYRDRLKQLFLSIFGRQYAKSFQALRDINLEIRKGETLGIIGVNGSGKSTLLQIIVGVLQPSSGVVYTKGRITALLELGAGFSPEFTGRENIFLNGAILGIREQEMKRILPDIIEFAQIGDYLDQPVKFYSSGMYLRLAFSIATSVHPEILVIDEALAVGDVGFINRCMKRMKNLKDSGTTIILVSHDIQAVRNFCSSVVWLDKGEICDSGSTYEVTSRYVQSLYASPWNANQSDETGDQAGVEIGDLQMGMNPLPLAGENLTRWGSGEIQIIAYDVLTSHGRMKAEVYHDTPMKIDIVLRASSSIQSDQMGVGISILNKMGLSVITSTTYDEGIIFRPLQQNQAVKISFEFDVILAPGEYSLNLNVEDRTNTAPHYFDFIENVFTFRVVSLKNIYSIVLPKVTQNIEYLS